MSFLGKLFGKKELPLNIVDLSSICTDFHSHLIDGIDDGVNSVEESMIILSALSQFGYKKVITTPHIMSDYFKNTPEIIELGYKRILNELQLRKIPIELEFAAEYYLDYAFENLVKQNNLLTFGDKYVLVELSYLNPPNNLNDISFELICSGYKPILAHPERYLYWANDISKFEELKDRGWLFQLNIMALMGYYSPQTKILAEKMIDLGLYNFIGTDVHNEKQIAVIEDALKLPIVHKLVNSKTLMNSVL